ncbi:MAG: ADP-dependent glucokinase/phosphofructokinase [bacterium]
MGSESEILLGLGNSLDYDILWEPQAIAALAADWGIDAWPAPPEHIRDERDLLCAILAYSAAGIGTEQAVDSADVIESTARKLGFRESLGGTGVRAGRVLDMLGIECTIHLSSVSPETELLLWHNARYLAGRHATALYPHLIVQFRDNEPITVGGISRTPPRPNRLIFVNDPDNAALDLAPDLPDAVAASSIWLISGINAIAEESHLVERLDQIAVLSHTVRPGSWVVYEDSGFHRQSLSTIVLEAMAAACDIVGMNEDEFMRHLAAPIELTDAQSVRAGMVELAARWNITNLLVHTARWAAILGPQSEELRPALSDGVLAGAARFSHGDRLTPQHLADLSFSPRNPIGARVAAGLGRAGFTAVAGLDLNPPEPVTIGLGDTFVGGFLAGLHRSTVRADSPRRRLAVAPVPIREAVRDVDDRCAVRQPAGGPPL